MRAVLLLGTVQGLTIALLTAGIVLVFKVGRYINLAHAQLGVVPAMILGKLSLEHHVNWWAAFAISLALGSAIAVACQELVMRHVRGGRGSLLIATVGLSQVLLAASFWDWLGPSPRLVALHGYPLPFQAELRVDALSLGAQHVLTLALVPVLVLGLAVALRVTALGKALRATASNPDAASLAGISPQRMAAVAWGLAGALAAVSAVLAAPGRVDFDTAALGPSVLLLALGAAAFGGFTSLPQSLAAAVALGLLQAIIVDRTRDSGLAQVWVFGAILFGLFVRSRAIGRAAAGRGDGLDTELRSLVVPTSLRSQFVVRHGHVVVALPLLVAAVALPHLGILANSGDRFVLSMTLIYALVALSVTMLTGWAGQLSLGQFAFAGVGAYTAARVLADDVPLLIAIVAAGMAGAVLAVVVGVPALRLSGLTLAVTTVGLAVVTPSWIVRQSWFGPSELVTIRPPTLPVVGAIGDQLTLYYVTLVAFLAFAAASSALRRSVAGRRVLAVRDNEPAATALGIAPTPIRLKMFALSGFTAAVAGAFWLLAWRSISPTLVAPQTSLLLLSVAVVGGLGSVGGAVAGAVAIYALPTLMADVINPLFPDTEQFQLLLGGLALMGTQVHQPGGIAGVARSVTQRWLDRRAAAAMVPADGPSGSVAHPAEGSGLDRRRPSAIRDEPPLVVTDVSVRFGGVVAASAVSMHVGQGEIVGLIGSNGAGKTTLLNVVSGLLPAQSGQIEINGHDVTRLRAARRAGGGLARSFQDARLFPSLSCVDTIQLAVTRRDPLQLVASTLCAPWTRVRERRSRLAAEFLLAEFGLSGWRDVPTRELSTGMRRLCDLAAQLATTPCLLLLDEPTAGVAQREAAAIGRLIRGIVDRTGCAVLIIEHDMPLMFDIADRVYCMSDGAIIAEGTPDEIRRDGRVVAAYLGANSDPGGSRPLPASR